MCASFIPYPTPLASLLLGRILVEILDSVDMTLIIFAFEVMGDMGVIDFVAACLSHRRGDVLQR